MMSITLSSEQIRSAPPEVRRWLEREIAGSLGLQARAGASQRHAAQLAACTHDELAAILSMIQGIFPVVSVFFELGRNGASFAQDRLEGYRLADIQHHTRLQTAEQVISCLELINESLHRIRGTTAASFYGIDGDYCFVATETQQNIRRLWFEVIGRGNVAAGEPVAPAGDGPAVGEPAAAKDTRPASGTPAQPS